MSAIRSYVKLIRHSQFNSEDEMRSQIKVGQKLGQMVGKMDGGSITPPLVREGKKAQ